MKICQNGLPEKSAELQFHRDSQSRGEKSGHARSPVYKSPEFQENSAVKTRQRVSPKDIIRRLLRDEKLGVLATHEPCRPYQSLVAFAVSPDLKRVYFATETQTRKHANLIRSPQVSILFDDRRNAADDFHRGIAVTAQGRARPVNQGYLESARRLFLRKHPSLEGFLDSPTCRLFAIDIKTYILVTEFQKVKEVRVNS